MENLKKYGNRGMGWGALIVPILLTVSGCMADPLVYHDDGALRTTVTMAEIVDAEIPACGASGFASSDADGMIPIVGEAEVVLHLTCDVAYCVGPADDGLPDDKGGQGEPEGDLNDDGGDLVGDGLNAGPTPQPSTPTDANSPNGPTPQPSLTIGTVIVAGGPTPQPSSND